MTTVQIAATTLAGLRAIATGQLRHLYNGACPDQIEGYSTRDDECAACRVILALEGECAAQGVSLPEPEAVPAANLPVQLPEHWQAELDETFGVVVRAREANGAELGYVTVNEDRRGFILGIGPVNQKGQYRGAQWRTALYLDAIGALSKAIA